MLVDAANASLILNAGANAFAHTPFSLYIPNILRHTFRMRNLSIKKREAKMTEFPRVTNGTMNCH